MIGLEPDPNKSLGLGGVRSPRNVGRRPGSGGHGPTSGGGCAAGVPAPAPWPVPGCRRMRRGIQRAGLRGARVRCGTWSRCAAR